MAAALAAIYAAIAVSPGVLNVSAAAASIVDLVPAHSVTVTVTPGHDVYMCTMLRVIAPAGSALPVVRRTQWHVTPGNLRNIHHILVRACDTDEQSHGPLGEPFHCNADRRKEAHCKDPWDSGYPLFFPRGFAQALGRHLMLEVHYKAPTGPRRIVDRSGIRLTLDLPSAHAHATALVSRVAVTHYGMEANLPLGHIPPRQPSYPVNFSCPATCVSCVLSRLGADALAIVALYHHMHAAGAGAATVVRRPSGAEFTLTREPTRMVVLKRPALVRRGDALHLTCAFNTSDRSTPTLLGEDHAVHEMCISHMIAAPVRLSELGLAKASTPPGEPRFVCVGARGEAEAGGVPARGVSARDAATQRRLAAMPKVGACPCSAGCRSFRRLQPSCG